MKTIIKPGNSKRANQQFIELQKELEKQNALLAKTQHELARAREELIEFSFVVSHNLRGPVSTIEGLLSLINKPALSRENAEFIRYIEETIEAIDNIAHDLNRIVSTRHAVSDIYQLVDLSKEIDALKSLFSTSMKECGAQVIVLIDPLPVFICVKQAVNTILHNLVSNSLKFRSPERFPEIEIKSFQDNGKVCIAVKDNGLGIEKEKHKERLFKPFSRIHHQISGKGLGLYMVKLLAESLGGHVELDSYPGLGTEVRVYLEAFPEGEEQVILDSSVTKITYYAHLQTMKAKWKRKINKEEFEELFEFILDFMKKYGLKNWIADITQAANDEDELNLVRRKYNDRIHNIGLQRMAIVTPVTEAVPEELEDKKMAIRSAYKFPVEFFGSDLEAFQWIGGNVKGPVADAAQ